jgi:hypothetical protein
MKGSSIEQNLYCFYKVMQIKTLQNAPRDADKLRKLLELNQRQKEEAMHIEDTERLVTRLKC